MQANLVINDTITRCPECGETHVDHTDLHLWECDRCLSRREE